MIISFYVMENRLMGFCSYFVNEAAEHNKVFFVNLLAKNAAFVHSGHSLIINYNNFGSFIKNGFFSLV